jgi:hypothetical protein
MCDDLDRFKILVLLVQAQTTAVWPSFMYTPLPLHLGHGCSGIAIPPGRFDTFFYIDEEISFLN